jgi:hypothetical protein
MPTRRAAETTPDLFTATPTPKAPGFQTIPVRENLGSQSRYLLPKDLAGALERLDDTEVDTLLAAAIWPVSAESFWAVKIRRGAV